MHGYHYPCPQPVYVPVVCVPAPTCCWPVKVPQSIEADPTNTPQSVIIGGTADVSLAVEYLIDPAAKAPSVTLTTSFGGVASTWNATDLSPGYHVQEAVLSAKPGTKATLAVTEAMARVRWCETICC